VDLGKGSVWASVWTNK